MRSFPLKGLVMMASDTVYVVILNWNGYQDTIGCLESVLASQNVKLKVVVCDNGSTDDSLAKIQQWARGDLNAQQPRNKRLERLMGNTSFPVCCQQITRQQAENEQLDSDTQLVLLANNANLGFAAGNNTGLQLALNQPDMSHVWLLNNDTLVDENCLRAMLDRVAQENEQAVCGSMIHFFDQPEIIQAIGGNQFNERTGCAAMSTGRFRHEDEALDVCTIEGDLDYISGCSMLLPRHFLESVGLMSEDYFLYYEEIDWFTRAAQQYRLCVARGARVYHKEGAAIGSKSIRSAASCLSDFYMFRSRLIFMRTHYSRYLFWCYVSSLGDVVKRIVRGHFANAWTVASVLLGKKEFTG